MRFPITLLTLATFCLGLSAQGNDTSGFPPPGKLINIGGRKLHLYCSGKGNPTFVLLPGGNAFSIDYWLVQSQLSAKTRVCSYDRAGLGWSDAGPAEETVEETVSDLHAVLRAAHETGPIFLVGASIAGIYIQAYQRSYPKDVVGLAFIDSSQRIGFNANGKSGMIWELSEDEIRSAFPLPPSVKKGPAPTREDTPFDKLPPHLQAVRLSLDLRLWKRSDPANATPSSLLSWRREFLREFQDSASSDQNPLGNLPVIVLSRGLRADDPARKLQQDGLALLSSNSLHLVATESDHEIHLYQPDLVVKALGRGVRAVRNRTPLIQTQRGP